MKVFILSAKIRKAHLFYMQAVCSPPLPVPELSKVIKHNKNGEKEKMGFYRSKLPNKILKSSSCPTSDIELILASLYFKCDKLEIFEYYSSWYLKICETLSSHLWVLGPLKVILGVFIGTKQH